MKRTGATSLPISSNSQKGSYIFTPTRVLRTDTARAQDQVRSRQSCLGLNKTCGPARPFEAPWRSAPHWQGPKPGLTVLTTELAGFLGIAPVYIATRNLAQDEAWVRLLGHSRFCHDLLSFHVTGLRAITLLPWQLVDPSLDVTCLRANATLGQLWRNRKTFLCDPWRDFAIPVCQPLLQIRNKPTACGPNARASP
jgi:hypothetical protein